MKRFIKKLLGLERKPDLSYLKYIENKSSILRDGFSLRLDHPKENKKYVSLGEGSILYCNIVFESSEGEVIIGNETAIANSSIICREKIVIEDHVFISWGCMICDHSFHSLDYMERREDYKNMMKDTLNQQDMNTSKDWDTLDVRPIRICEDVWIGMNCVIMQGVTIGKGAVIGANSVVRKNVPDFAIVAGNPAEIIATLPHT